MRSSLRLTRCRDACALPPMPVTLLLLLLLPLLAATAGATGAQGQSPPADFDADPNALDSPDEPLDPQLAQVEAAWLREADTALLIGQLARLLSHGDANAPDSAPANVPGEWGGPVLVFDSPSADDKHAMLVELGAMDKRSRYYRRYPWKRQPGRGDPPLRALDLSNPYLCNPSRQDVYHLLSALHEARDGNLGRTVSFCNRRRPAAAVFTNVRFLGRRRRR